MFSDLENAITDFRTQGKQQDYFRWVVPNIARKKLPNFIKFSGQQSSEKGMILKLFMYLQFQTEENFR